MHTAFKFDLFLRRNQVGSLILYASSAVMHEVRYYCRYSNARILFQMMLQYRILEGFVPAPYREGQVQHYFKIYILWYNSPNSPLSVRRGYKFLQHTGIHISLLDHSQRRDHLKTETSSGEEVVSETPVSGEEDVSVFK